MWAITIIILFGSLTIAPSYYTFGQTPSQDEIDQSIRQITENGKSMERLTLFARQCTDLIKSNDLSQLPACDAVYQKFNVDIGKFLAENEAVIESIIYPYTLPLDIQNKSTLNSSDVIGSSDRNVAMEHTTEALVYMPKIQMLSESCVGAVNLITQCMDIFKSLNDHFRDFNTNTQAEFNDVLSSPLGSSPSLPSTGVLKVLSSNSFIDAAGYLHLVGEIENGTPDPVTFVKATETFYDKNNNVVATDYSYTSPSDLGPGDKAPFEIILTSASIPVEQIDHHSITASSE